MFHARGAFVALSGGRRRRETIRPEEEETTIVFSCGCDGYQNRRGVPLLKNFGIQYVTLGTKPKMTTKPLAYPFWPEAKICIKE